MRSKDANEAKGSPRRGGRTVVRLDAAALLEAVGTAQPLSELARQGDRDKPRIPLLAGQRRGARPRDASDVGCKRPSE